LQGIQSGRFHPINGADHCHHREKDGETARQEKINRICTKFSIHGSTEKRLKTGFLLMNYSGKFQVTNQKTRFFQ
jgi:hypothetical protein